MSQPKWQFVCNLGDVNPLDYGGFLVFKDETGAYCPEATVILVNDDGIHIDRILMEDYDGDGWFTDELGAVASFIGSTVEELDKQLRSDDLWERGRAYQALTDYYGTENLGGDGYSLHTKFEAMNEMRRIMAGSKIEA